MECTDTQEWLEGLKAELQAAVDEMEGEVTVSDVACGSVLVTIEGDDLTNVETVEEIIVNEGVNLPSYGRVGGSVSLKEETTEEGAEDWVVALIAVAVVIGVILVSCFICKHMEKETHAKRSELRKNGQHRVNVDLELSKPTTAKPTPKQTNYSGTNI